MWQIAVLEYIHNTVVNNNITMEIVVRIELLLYQVFSHEMWETAFVSAVEVSCNILQMFTSNSGLLAM